METLPKYEIRSMPSLLEQRNNLITEMEGIIEKAKTETRSMDDAEVTQFDKIKKDIQNIDKTIQAEQEAAQISATEKAKSPEQEEKRALEEDKFLRFIKGDTRALDVANNGAIIPTDISNRIITRVKELSPIYQRATVFNVGGDLVFPAFDANCIVTDYIADMTALTAQNGNFTSRKLTKLYCRFACNGFTFSYESPRFRLSDIHCKYDGSKHVYIYRKRITCWRRNNSRNRAYS